MIKITFELSEEFIAHNVSEETIEAKIKKAEGPQVIKVLVDMIGFHQLKKQVDAGKTDFVVTPDKLNEKSQHIYNNELGEICMLAFLSETDKKGESKKQEVDDVDFEPSSNRVQAAEYRL